MWYLKTGNHLLTNSKAIYRYGNTIGKKNEWAKVVAACFDNNHTYSNGNENANVKIIIHFIEFIYVIIIIIGGAGSRSMWILYFITMHSMANDYVVWRQTKLCQAKVKLYFMISPCSMLHATIDSTLFLSRVFNFIIRPFLFSYIVHSYHSMFFKSLHGMKDLCA